MTAMVLGSSCSFALTNNHNNKYDPNTIYTSTQYLIDHDQELLKDEKKVMNLNTALLNNNNQISAGFGITINYKIANILKQKGVLSIEGFREIIDSIIENNIGNLPEQANEVAILNGILTKMTLNSLINNTIANTTNNTHYDLLLFNSMDNSIFGKKYRSNVTGFDNIKYKDKTCKFYMEKKHARFYYIVKLS